MFAMFCVWIKKCRSTYLSVFPDRRFRVGRDRRGIIVEYQSVCPFVGMGSPTPPPQASKSLPLNPKWGEAIFLSGERVGAPVRTTGREPRTLYSYVSSDDVETYHNVLRKKGNRNRYPACKISFPRILRYAEHSPSQIMVLSE